MRLRSCLAIIATLVLSIAHGASKLPAKVSLLIDGQQVVADLRPLLAETNNVEITRVSVCRRVGSRCHETLWRIEFPAGWHGTEIEVLGDYPGANVITHMPELLRVGGSYNVFIHFNERSRWHKQTVSNTVVEFCLAGEPGNWRLLDDATCLARRNAEDQQGATP